MTKQMILAIVVAILILVGGIGAFLYSKNKNANSNPPTAIETTQAPTSSNLEGSVKDILSSGKTSKCTFNAGDEKGETAGTVYVSGDKARGDFVVSVDGKNTNTHMIKDGNTFYLWGDTLKTGIKMTMNLDEMASKMNSNSSYSGFNPDQNVKYECGDWTKDDTVFAPPATIKFTSMDAMMPKTTTAPNANVTGKASQCSMCNSLSGEAKTACIQQLSCE